MELTLSTPALLFPAISLLLLAYTNRFLHLAALIRRLHSDYKTEADPLIIAQIDNLRHRLRLIKQMQALGVSSLLGCVLCMLVLFGGQELVRQNHLRRLAFADDREFGLFAFGDRFKRKCACTSFERSGSRIETRLISSTKG
jgi:hypothetical protein